DFLAAHHLQLHRIPDLRSGGRIERAAVLPRRRVESSLVDGAGRRDVARAAVRAGGRGERKRQRAGRGVVGVRVGRRRRLGRRLLRPRRRHRERADDDAGAQSQREQEAFHGGQSTIRAMSEPQTFLDHLDELRTRIIRSCIAIGLGMLVAWAFVDRLADFVLGPTLRSLPPGSSLIFTKPGEAFSFDLDVALIFGVVFAAPFVMYQVWLFIAPALYANEKRFVVPLVVAAAISTLAGGLFSHFVLFPGMVGFFAGFRTPHVQFVPRLEDTFDLYKNMTIGMVVVFQIPTLVLFLARLRLVTAGLLWRHVKYAVLVSFIVAAVLTPSADPWNQTVFAAPMIALYLISIAIAWLARPRGDAGANDSALMRLVIAAALLRRAVARRRLIAGTSAALIALACTGLASGTVVAQAPAASDLTVYEGMRLIRGDARLGPAV